VPKYDVIKVYGGVEVLLHAFLTSALDGSEWSASCLGHFIPSGKGLGTHWIEDWVGLRAGTDAVEKRKDPCTCQESNPSHLAHSLITILMELSWLLIFS
jgi:hypothetical protein